MPVLAVQHIVDAGETHRSDAGEESHLASVLYLHRVDIRTRGGVIAGVHRADHAGERLAE